MKTPPKRTPSALRQYLIEQGHTELLDEPEDQAIRPQSVSNSAPQEERSARRDRRHFSVIASPLSRKSLAKFLERNPALQKSVERKRERDGLLHELELRDHCRMQEWVNPRQPGFRFLVAYSVPSRFKCRNAWMNFLGIFDPKKEYPIALKALHLGKCVHRDLTYAWRYWIGGSWRLFAKSPKARTARPWQKRRQKP